MGKSITGYGVLFIILGIVAYVATSMVSVTALIPAFFGIVFVAIGALGRKESLSKPSLYAALVLAVIGLFGSFSGIPQVITLVTGGDLARPAASISRAIMAVLLIAMVFSLVRALRASRGTRA